MSTTHENRPATATRPAVAPLALAAAAALALNLIAFGIGRLAGASFVVTRPDGVSFPVAPLAVAAMTLIPMVVGACAVLVARRWWPKGVQILAWSGLAIGVLTVAMPLLSQASAQTRIALAAMHLITGVVWVLGVRRLSR